MLLDRAGYAAVETELGFFTNEAALEHDQFVKRFGRGSSSITLISRIARASRSTIVDMHPSR